MSLNNKIKHNCIVCGTEHLANRYRLLQGNGQGVFCSTKCYYFYKSSSSKKVVKCSVCGCSIERKKSELKKSKTGVYYCSKKCLIKSTEKINRVCESCGRDFKSIPYRVKNGKAKYCSRQCVVVGQKFQNTSIEIKIENELIRRGVSFNKQYPIWSAKTIPDFFIPPNICVYADGDYWHGTQKQKAIDSRQNSHLKLLGYVVYRFWEHDINYSVSGCVDKILEIKK